MSRVTEIRKSGIDPQENIPLKAICLHKFGGPEVLSCNEIPLPEPGVGEKRVKIEAARMTTGELSVWIDKAFPLAEVAEAHRYLEGRKTQGKLLLIP